MKKFRFQIQCERWKFGILLRNSDTQAVLASWAVPVVEGQALQSKREALETFVVTLVQDLLCAGAGFPHPRQPARLRAPHARGEIKASKCIFYKEAAYLRSIAVQKIKLLFHHL